MACNFKDLSQSKPLSIAIIEDNAFIRSSIISLLRRELTGWNFVQMTSVDEVRDVAPCSVRLVILDICEASFEDPALRASIAAVRDAFPRADIGVLADRAGTELAVEALKRGVRGVFEKSQPIEAMLCAIRIVLAGGFYCPRHDGAWDSFPDFEPLSAHGDFRGEDDPVALFTPRERAVLEELRLGRSNKVIAAQLGLSENTVKMHIQRIMRKLQVQNRTEIVVRLAGAGQDGPASAAARALS